MVLTIVSSTSIISAKIVETKPQLNTKILTRGKEAEIDLDEEIVIPNWDISNLTPDQMHIFGELI